MAKPTSAFAIHEPDAHQVAATVCVVYLLWESENGGKNVSYRPNTSRRLLLYAARFWPTHVHDTPDKGRKMLELTLLNSLFDSTSNDHLTFWLNLYKPNRGSALHALFKLRRTRKDFPPPLYYSSLLG